MTLPTFVAQTSAGTDDVDAASLTVSLPASGIVLGDVLIAAFASRTAGGTIISMEDSTGPDAWTQEFAGGGGFPDIFIYSKVADGDESGETVTLTFTNTTDIAGQVLQFRNCTGTITSDATEVTNSGTTIDPPAITNSWGTGDTMYVTMTGVRDDGGIITGWPTGYSGQFNKRAGTGTLNNDCCISVAYKADNSGSDTPSTMTCDQTEVFTAQTISIEGSSAVGPDFVTVLPQRLVRHSGRYR